MVVVAAMMVKQMHLYDLFDFSYGSNLDLNKMKKTITGINFVSRTFKNLGVSAQVERLDNKNPYDQGLITVSLGGSILESFVQPRPFYTGQNVLVLVPKHDMTFQEKVYYCICIKHNRIRYTAYGREANRTLMTLNVPDRVPDWVLAMPDSHGDELLKSFSETNVSLSDRKWSAFQYDSLFDIEVGKGSRKTELDEHGDTPLVTSIDGNNGLVGMVNAKPMHHGNVITVNRNGSVGEAFYQQFAFCSTGDVHVFKPKFGLNPYRAMFLISIIRKEKYRYNYGRKWGIKRMNKSVMLLPVNDDGNPDWQFMEDYIKSLPYSNNLKVSTDISLLNS